LTPSSAASAATFSSTTTRPEHVDVEVLFVPVFQDADGLEDLPGLDEAAGGELGRARASGEFRARPYEWIMTPLAGPAWRPKRVALVGAGERKDWDAERMKRVAALCGHVARARRMSSMAWLVRDASQAVRVARMAADGLSAAEYDTGTYRGGESKPGPYPATCVVVAPGASEPALADAVRQGRIIGEAVNVSRSLANEPGNILTPREFADRISALATSAGLAVDVLDEARIRALGMGLLLGVAQGSAEPPRVIVLRHEPAGAPASPVIALIGKGVTFDSGGISIKPADGMDRMKDDMSGGAAVAAAMQALARLGAPTRVIGVIPTAENMPGGRATRPGDVLTAASGKTVEIINTDAEGRLLLGDALWYAQQLGATHLIDVATLTGACVVALGHHVSGLFGTDPGWVQTVAAAAARAGDRVWPMPLYEEAREQLRSEIADLVNSAGRHGGAVTAAAFLREFIGDRPWAHLDIAGTAWAEMKQPYQPKGPTGAAVRTLIEIGMTGTGSSRESRD
jgi:leucyl aminopeptidase